MELKFHKISSVIIQLLRLNRTFMELKYNSWGLQICEKIRFKSHLYGIEIKKFLFSLSSTECLNRTFMELKFAPRYVYKRVRLFKSHLYGIEIYVYNSAIVEKLCLNRTFMELKFSKLVIAYSFLVNV